MGRGLLRGRKGCRHAYSGYRGLLGCTNGLMRTVGVVGGEEGGKEGGGGGGGNVEGLVLGGIGRYP